MTIQPKHSRIDLGMVLRAALAAELPGSEVLLDRDAEYTPDQVTTVISVGSFTSTGLAGNRWLFQATAVLSTTGPDYDAAAAEADRVGDAVLSLTDYRGVRFSSVACVSEPQRAGRHEPTGAETVVQTFSLMARKENPNG